MITTASILVDAFKRFGNETDRRILYGIAYEEVTFNGDFFADKAYIEDTIRIDAHISRLWREGLVTWDTVHGRTVIAITEAGIRKLWKIV